MSIKPGENIKDDYPPLNDKIEKQDHTEPNEENEKMKADLEDKQPAGDAGPEDAIEEKEKKDRPPY